MGKDVNKQWVEEILNPDTVRTKFVMMGLFMVAHELLEDSIKSTPLSFFADKWKDGKPIQSEDYKAEVLALDPKGKNDVQRGSIEWLKKMSAIDDTDARSIREVTDERNDFAHEMRHIVSGWARRHRSKCGNSSLHTRAGLSRGTQCSGSGVSNDARARQRPWISAVSARADSRAA